MATRTPGRPGRCHRRRCDCPLDGEPRYNHSGKYKDRRVHNRHCSDFEHPGEGRNGGVYGRTCDAAYHRTGHVNLVHCGSGRELDGMIDLLIHEPCNEPDFRSRHGGVRHTGFTGLCGPGRITAAGGDLRLFTR
jgi:hypothetical protein